MQPKPNQHPGLCKRCGKMVQPKEGLVKAGKGGASGWGMQMRTQWIVEHLTCPVLDSDQ